MLPYRQTSFLLLLRRKRAQIASLSVSMATPAKDGNPDPAKRRIVELTRKPKRIETV